MVSISYAAPNTSFATPSPEELRSLQAIVEAAHPWLVDKDDRRDQKGAREYEFARAFWAAGHFYRLAEPRHTRRFSYFVDAANQMLRERGSESVSGNALLAAILAHGDIAWTKHDPIAGTVLEVGLDPYAGAKCRNRWREILKGANLLAPTPAREHLARGAEPSPVSFWRKDMDGSMRAIAADEPLWGR